MRIANWKAINILIVPAAARAHAGIAGPFTQLTFPKFQTLVWLEAENSSLFVEEERAVEGYEAVVKALGAVSLDEDRSMELIARLQEINETREAQHREEDNSFPPS
ncbi:hypothetical protein ADL03_06335 [Nocardia sp. NRRL S-836]|nr:hypothetical protein ADL03_06335 [Nocardia sp. NRRL S-836]